MIAQNDHLVGAAAELRQAVAENTAGRGPQWAERLGRALADVERELRQRAGDRIDDGETLSDQDLPLIPSPGVERRAEGLRQELIDLIQEVRVLRTEVMTSHGTPTGTGAATFTERVQNLVQALQRQEHGEIDLMQKSITHDVGAGD